MRISDWSSDVCSSDLHYSTSAPSWPGIWLIQTRACPEVEMAIIIFLLSLAVVAGVCCWFLQKWLGEAYVRYQQAFKKHERDRLDELFLFVDAAHLWLDSNALCTVLIAGVYVQAGCGVGLEEWG